MENGTSDCRITVSLIDFHEIITMNVQHVSRSKLERVIVFVTA